MPSPTDHGAQRTKRWSRAGRPQNRYAQAASRVHDAISRHRAHSVCHAPGPIAHPIEIIRLLAHCRKDHTQHIDVAPLAIGSDQIGLAQPPAREDLPNSARMIVDMDPIAHIEPISIELRTLARKDPSDLARNKLLDMLIRAIIVRAVRNSNWRPYVRYQAHTSRSEAALVEE